MSDKTCSVYYHISSVEDVVNRASTSPIMTNGVVRGAVNDAVYGAVSGAVRGAVEELLR